MSPLVQGRSLESIEHLFAMPWNKRVDVLYYLRYVLQLQASIWNMLTQLTCPFCPFAGVVASIVLGELEWNWSQLKMRM